MAEGDIGNQIGVLEFNAVAAENPDIIHVAGNVYAIAAEETAFKGKITCVTIPTTGNPTLISGGVLEFDAAACEDPIIIHITGTVYAVVYRGNGFNGQLKTINITDAGIPTLISGGALEFDAAAGMSAQILHIAGTVYAIAYEGELDDGYIKTVNITDAGIPTLISGGVLEFDTTLAYYLEFIHITGTVYAVVYMYIGQVLRVRTINITDAGVPTLISGGLLEFASEYVTWPKIIHISGDVYAITYKGTGNEGCIKTVTISAAGAIAEISGGYLEFDATFGEYARIAHISGNVFVVAYKDGPNNGWLRTVTISADGTTLALTGSYKEFETIVCEHPDIIHISGDVYAFPYSGDGADGWIRTFPIETIAAGNVKHLMMVGIG